MTVHRDDHPSHHGPARSHTGNQEEPWFPCAAGVGEKKHQEGELHRERCVGGMKEGTEETWEVSAALFTKTTQ